MMLLPLSCGGSAIVDDADFSRVSVRRWRLDRKGYVVASAGPRKYALHRVIMDAAPRVSVDHINGDPLDNRRANLRFCTNQQNSWNQRATGGTSRFRGVCWNSKSKRWQAAIRKDRKTYHLGLFDREDDAARAYDEAAARMYGEFARPNLPAASRPTATPEAGHG